MSRWVTCRDWWQLLVGLLLLVPQAGALTPDVRLQQDPRLLPGIFRAGGDAWLTDSCPAMLAASEQLVEQEQALSSVQRQLAQYWQVRCLLRSGRAEALAQVSDTLGRMAGGDTLTGLGFVQLILAADQEQLRPELLLFLLQRLEASVELAGAVDAGLSTLLDPVRLLVYWRLKDAGLNDEALALKHRMSWQGLPWAAAAVAQAGQLLNSGSRALALGAVDVAQTWRPALRDEQLLQMQLMRRLASPTSQELTRLAFLQRLAEHQQAIRSWQVPDLLAELTELWRGRQPLPDSWASPDFPVFVGCDHSPLWRCSVVAQAYLYLALRDVSVRSEWLAFNELARVRQDLAMAHSRLQRLAGDTGQQLTDDDLENLLEDRDESDWLTGLAAGERQEPVLELDGIADVLDEHLQVVEQQQRTVLVQALMNELAGQRQTLELYKAQLLAEPGAGVWSLP